MNLYEGRNLTTHKRVAIGASATSAVNTAVLDLGNRHTFVKLVGKKTGAASANEALIFEYSHNGDAESPTWFTAPNLAMTGVCASPSSGTDMVVGAVPMARWARLKHTNGDTAQTVLVLEITALPA